MVVRNKILKAKILAWQLGHRRGDGDEEYYYVLVKAKLNCLRTLLLDKTVLLFQKI